MGHPSTISALVTALFAASAALAQQELIVEPWHQPARPAVAPLLPVKQMPASGLPPVSSTPPASLARQPPLAAPVVKWTPPVVALLVDPWDRAAAEPPAPDPRWLAPPLEIVDPWADEAAPDSPRVARRPAPAAARSTIF